MSDKKFGHRYQKIFSRIWEDEKFIALSTPAQLIYLYLQSNRSLSIVGFYILAFPANKMVCGFTDWAMFKKYLNEVIAVDMVKFDEEKSLILITNFLKYNPIQSPTQLEGAHKVLVDLPKSQLFYDFLDHLEDPKISELGINAQLIPIVRNMLGAVGNEPIEPTTIHADPIMEIVEDTEIKWVVEKWNVMCRLVGLPTIFKITDQRRIAIKKRLEEYSAEKIEEVFNLVSKSAFLLGENDRGWKADFDFVMNKSKFPKILEGSYQGKSTTKKDTITGSMEAIQRAAEEQFPHNQIETEDVIARPGLAGQREARRGEGFKNSTAGEGDELRDVSPGFADDSGEF